MGIVTFFGYWHRVHQRAFRDARKALFVGTGSAVVIAVFVAAISLLLVLHLVGAEEAHIELTDRLLGWLSPFLVFPMVYLWRMVVAPVELDTEAQQELRRLTPRLQLDFTEQQGVVRIGWGAVGETVTGKRYTAETQSEIIFRILCTNKSAIRCENCRAFLMKVMAVDEDGTLSDVGFLEPIQLSWSRDLSPAELETSLEPGIPKAIYVLTRRQHPALMIYRPTKDIPLEYGRLFSDHGKYRLWLRVNSSNDAVDTVCVDVWPIDEEKRPWSIGVEIIESGRRPPLSQRHTSCVPIAYRHCSR